MIAHAPIASLTVAIASKNRPADIAVCLASILQAPTQPLEIIVLDQSAAPYALPAAPHLRHVYDPHVTGLPAARNRCIDLARGDAVLFIDDDVEFTSDVVHELLGAFGAHPDGVAVQCAIRLPYERSLRQRLVRYVFSQGYFAEHSSRTRAGVRLRTLAGCGMAFRRDLLARERFDERLSDYACGEDWEYSKRAARYGTLWLAEGARIMHHQSPVNRYRLEKMLQERFNNFVYFYDKHQAARNPLNRFWLAWWMIGEELRDLRSGVRAPLHRWYRTAKARSDERVAQA